MTGRVVLVDRAQPSGHHALRQVVDPPPGLALDAHDVADRQEPLERDLLRRPMPPHVLRPWGLAPRAAEVRGGERSARLQRREHLAHRPLVRGPARMDPSRAEPAARREVRPELHREDAVRVGDPLERARRLAPVRRFDRRPAHRAEARVGDELVRARKDRDRVELNGTHAAKHRSHVRVAGTDEALRVQGEGPRFVGRELRRHAGRVYQRAR